MTPIGQYSSEQTFIHRLDPRLKLAINITYIVLTFLSYYFISLFILLVPLVIAYLIGTKRWLNLVKLLKMPLIVGFFILFVNIYTMKVVYASDWIIFFYIGKSGHYAFTYQALARTLALVLRIYIMIMVTSLFVTTTKPILLTKAFEDLMLPLKLLFIPTHIIAMIISIALRFIPTLLDESRRIMKAQASRGIDFKNGKIKEKAKSFTTLIIPLFVTSFSKAEDLSNAMETRGYDPYAKRTRYRKLHFTWRDFLVLFIAILLVIYIALTINNVFPLPEWYTITETFTA